MKLVDLSPEFIRYVGDDMMHTDDVAIADADGIMFLCPTCYRKNGGPKGTHRVICNRPRVPQGPKRVGPGRWEFKGSGFADLTLVAGSSSIALEGGCKAHFFVRNGDIVMA